MYIGSMTVALATTDGVIPASCREPSGIDSSRVGSADYGPYSVKLKSWTHLPWGTSSAAIVGHDQTPDSLEDYGVTVGMESTDIGAFTCVWTNEGVTIVEPRPDSGAPGVEHFVPAARFLGGR